jgi:hypothetical protein
VDLLELANKAGIIIHQQGLTEGKIMGGSNVDVSKIPKVDDSWRYSLLGSKRDVGNIFLQGQGQALVTQSKLPPQTQTFNTDRVSQQAAEFGVGNAIKAKEVERFLDPSAARMREESGSDIASLTNIQTFKQGMDDLAKRRGITSGYVNNLANTIGRSPVYDITTGPGRVMAMRNLALQQGYLAQTPAPIGGLDPATAIQAEMEAKKQNLQAMQQFQQNVMAGGQRLQQSTSDFINQNLGELQQANQVEQQNKQQREQMMYEAAVKKAAGDNSMTGTYIGAGGAVAGAALGAAIII